MNISVLKINSGVVDHVRHITAKNIKHISIFSCYIG